MGFVSDIFGGGAAKKAAKAQVEGAKLGIGELQRQFDLSRGDLAPWREAGGQAIGQGLAMLQPDYDHTTSPGYQFRFGEGQRAVESGAASKGMLMSGGTLKDLTRFGQGVAADDFNDQFNRTMAVAGGGQSQLIGLGSMFLSDRRLKTNLERVGEYEDGLGIYEWNWKADPDGERFRGVIADEVKALRPWAFVENFRNGFDGVNYGALNAH
jgi:hypothetical protein